MRTSGRAGVCFTVIAVIAIGLLSPVTAMAEVKLQFMFPVEVAGRLAKVMVDMVDVFNKTHPGIKVEAIYSGAYGPTMQKVQTAVQAGKPPDVTITNVSELPTLVAMDAILPLDELIQREGGKGFLDQYFAAFLANSTLKGKFWGLPFQRSTPVLYWNKEMFAKAGLNAERGPDTWDELVEFGKRVTIRDASGQTKQWGLSMPSSFRDWPFSALALQNGGDFVSPGSTEVYFNRPETVGALEFLVDLVNKHKILSARPAGGKAVPEFLSQTSAMLIESSGNMSFIKKSANFKWGVAFLPKHKRRATPVGGGNIWILKNIPKQNQEAAWTFVKYMTAPQAAAEWAIETGYVAVNKKSWDLPVMKKYLEEFPEQAVACDQLEYAYPRWSPINFGQVQRVLNNRIEDAIDQKLTPKQAMDLAQAEADKLMKE